MLVRHMLYQLSYDSVLVVFYHSDMAKSTFLLLQRSMFFGDSAKMGAKKDKKQLKSFLISDTIHMFDRRAWLFGNGEADRQTT